MKHILYLSLLTLVIVGYSCKKEYSQEESSGNKSEGSLVSEATGECLPKKCKWCLHCRHYSGRFQLYRGRCGCYQKKGDYTIITDTVNGYYFTASGEFNNTGINTVKLLGKGKPLAEGSDFFMVRYDSTFCEVEVEVLPTGSQPPPPPPVTGTYFWKFTVSGTTYQGSVNINDAEMIDTTFGGFTFKTFYFEAEDSAGDNLMSLALVDVGSGINVNETYSSPPGAGAPGNSVYFDWDDANGNFYETSTSTFTAKVTFHSTSTKVIKGTFSGTAKDVITGATKTITNGVFEVNYP